MALPAPRDSGVALITGASSGIGAELARELAGRGHGVLLVARREQRLRELADELAGGHSIRAEVIAADLGDAAARARLAESVDELGLEVEILANNAGFGGYGSFVEQDRARELEMIRINVEAVADLQARFLGPMVERGRGAVLNVASTAAFQPMPGGATYAATKAFVLTLGEAVHEEVAASGVTVTTVCPGPVRTEFSEIAGTVVLEDIAPELVWSTPRQIAREALEGAAKGKRVVVPGALNKTTAIAGRHTPRALVLPLLRRFWARQR